jgi:hypothetical protein
MEDWQQNPLAQSGMAISTELEPKCTFIAFLALAFVNCMFEYILLFAERESVDTSYQPIIQRIYRALMDMVLTTFLLNMISAGGANLPTMWSFAYQFVDQLAFTMAIFFCLQGFLIILFSVQDGIAWKRAEYIRGHDLLIDVDATMKNNPRLWKYRLLPFNATRDQVEFRMFRCIFTMKYNIGGDGQSFDFSHYLKSLHEESLLEIIDLDYIKWGIILVLVAIICILQKYAQANCDSFECTSRYEMIFYTLGGILLFIFSIVIAYQYRKSELKLLSKFGIVDITDYDIYLMKEESIKTLYKERMVDMKTLIRVINELKHDSAVKKFKASGFFIKEIENETNNFVELSKEVDDKVKQPSNNFHKAVMKVAIGNMVMKNQKIAPALITNKQESKRNIAPLSVRNQSSVFNMLGTLKWASSKKVASRKKSLLLDAEVSAESMRVYNNNLSAVDESSKHRKSSNVEIFNDDNNTEPMENILNDNDVDDDMHDDDDDDIEYRKHKHKENIIQSNITKKRNKHIENQLRNKLKSALHNGDEKMINFKDVYLFHNPKYLTYSIHFIITAMCLNLGYWIINFIFVAFDTSTVLEHIIWAIAPTIPLILTFPVLALSIKSATLLKGLSELDIEKVVSTIRRTENVNKNIDFLRKSLLIRLAKVSGKGNERRCMNDAFNEMDERNVGCLNLEDFSKLLVRLQIFVTKTMASSMFDSVDLNISSTIQVEVNYY